MTTLCIIDVLPGETDQEAIDRVKGRAATGSEILNATIDLASVSKRVEALALASGATPEVAKAIAVANVEFTKKMENIEKTGVFEDGTPVTVKPPHKGTFCSLCGSYIYPTGKRGRPALKCAECKGKK